MKKITFHLGDFIFVSHIYKRTIMDKHKQINESILLGYFTGTLSIPLQQEVEDWISASEENKK